MCLYWLGQQSTTELHSGLLAIMFYGALSLIQNLENLEFDFSVNTSFFYIVFFKLTINLEGIYEQTKIKRSPPIL